MKSKPKFIVVGFHQSSNEDSTSNSKTKTQDEIDPNVRRLFPENFGEHFDFRFFSFTDLEGVEPEFWVADNLTRFLRFFREIWDTTNPVDRRVFDLYGIVQIGADKHQPIESWKQFEPLLTRSKPLDAIASLIVLSAPEVTWFCHPVADPFSYSLDEKNLLNLSFEIYAKFGDTQEFSDREGVLKRIADANLEGWTSLFDPIGARHLIKSKVAGSLSISIPNRRKIGYAIDEEADYSLVNAYAFYRGSAMRDDAFRALPITGWRLMKRYLKSKHRYKDDVKVLEDWHLEFPDQEKSVDPVHGDEFESKDLVDRTTFFTGLSEVVRVFLTSGEKKAMESEIKRTKQAINESKLDHRNILFKPVPGLHFMLRKLFLIPYKEFHQRPSISKVADFLVLSAVGLLILFLFNWNSTDWSHLCRIPIFMLLVFAACRLCGLTLRYTALMVTSFRHRNVDNSIISHSAPGTLVQVANSLVERSRSVLDNAISPGTAIYAATLALEAKELLGRRTPTLALQALLVQYDSEVHAECLFLGIDQNIDVSIRLSELREEVDKLTQSIGRNSKKQSVLNARLAISDAIAQRFRSHGQIEEVLQCEQEARLLRSKFYLNQQVEPKRWWPIKKIMGLAFCYGAYLLSSLTRYCVLCIFWVLLFAFVYNIGVSLVGYELSSDSNWILDSAQNFFTFSQSDTLKETFNQGDNVVNTTFRSIVGLQALLGIAHLGVFLSHLYIRISRH